MKVIHAPNKIPGGVHPAYFKELARDKQCSEMPLPAKLVVSMAQHLGAPAKPTVKKGDTVLRGERIGEAAGFISAHVHAPTSGTVSAVDDAVTAMGKSAPAVTIEPDGEDRWCDDLTPCTDWRNTPAKELIRLVAKAGVAGMGGAGFPTHVKLSPPTDKPIDTLIINGAECEPYLCADHRLMVEKAKEVAEGILIIRHILGAKVLRVAIEDNKPEAIKAMSEALSGADGDIAVVSLHTSYPQGAEKQQIYAITGREVPSGGLPMDVGSVVENVGTCLAVHDAVVTGRPLTERVTTVTGPTVRNPSNILARIGTRYADMVEFAGGTDGVTAKVISGGPMMGFAQASLAAATTKTTSGLLLIDNKHNVTYDSTPCIACGRCVDSCPMCLVPSELSQFMEADDMENAEGWHIMDCIECGCCSFACPAHRPLVQHMRRGKAAIMLKRREESAK